MHQRDSRKRCGDALRARRDHGSQGIRHRRAGTGRAVNDATPRSSWSQAPLLDLPYTVGLQRRPVVARDDHRRVVQFDDARFDHTSLVEQSDGKSWAPVMPTG